MHIALRSRVRECTLISEFGGRGASSIRTNSRRCWNSQFGPRAPRGAGCSNSAGGRSFAPDLGLPWLAAEICGLVRVMRCHRACQDRARYRRCPSCRAKPASPHTPESMLSGRQQSVLTDSLGAQTRCALVRAGMHRRFLRAGRVVSAFLYLWIALQGNLQRRPSGRVGPKALRLS
jgi:hypothetical protein